MFSCYLKLERRQTAKKDGSESKTPRYVVIAQAGYFRPLDAIKSANDEIVMYLLRTEKSGNKSGVKTRLQCKGSVNFSSIYLNDLKNNETLIGHGEPPQAKELKSGKLNPFFDNRQDGYIFVISPDMATIEILIMPQGRQLIAGYAAKLADGFLNAEMHELRKAAR